jgi:hypothetical protein
MKWKVDIKVTWTMVISVHWNGYGRIQCGYVESMASFTTVFHTHKYMYIHTYTGVNNC